MRGATPRLLGKQRRREVGSRDNLPATEGLDSTPWHLKRFRKAEIVGLYLEEICVTGLAVFQHAKVGAATAAVVVLGAVTVPSDQHASPIIRTEVAAVQLQAAVSTQIALLVSASAASTPSAAATAAPADLQAAATIGTDLIGTDFLTTVATAAIAVVGAPLWYLAFPVTLPLSVIGGLAYFNVADELPFGLGGQFDPIARSLIGAFVGLGAFFVGPPALAFGALASFVTAATPAAAVLPPASAAVGPATAPDSSTVGAPADASGASDTSAVASVSDALPTRLKRGAAQHATETAQTSVSETAVADMMPSTRVKTDISDGSETTTVSDIVSGADSAPADDGPEASTDTLSPSTGPTRSANRAPSAQHADKTATSARAGRGAHK